MTEKKIPDISRLLPKANEVRCQLNKWVGSKKVLVDLKKAPALFTDKQGRMYIDAGEVVSRERSDWLVEKSEELAALISKDKKVLILYSLLPTGKKLKDLDKDPVMAHVHADASTVELFKLPDVGTSKWASYQLIKAHVHGDHTRGKEPPVSWIAIAVPKE